MCRERGLCAGGAAAFRPQEGSRDEKRGLGTTLRSDCWQQHWRCATGRHLSSGLNGPLAKAVWELIIEEHSPGLEDESE